MSLWIAEVGKTHFLNVLKSFCLTYKYAKCHQPNGVLCIQVTLLLTKRGHLHLHLLGVNVLLLDNWLIVKDYIKYCPPSNDSVIPSTQIICLDRLIVSVCVFNEGRRGICRMSSLDAGGRIHYPEVRTLCAPQRPSLYKMPTMKNMQNAFYGPQAWQLTGREIWILTLLWGENILWARGRNELVLWMFYVVVPWPNGPLNITYVPVFLYIPPINTILLSHQLQ